jgi:histidinol-phosphate phosphatase family protein
MALKPAIFLDKDGTVLRDRPYNVDPALMEFAPGARAGLRRLASLNRPMIVISNQPGVALGYFKEDMLAGVQRRLREMFEEAGAQLRGFFYCPHHPAGVAAGYGRTCLCRKPAPGLLQRAARAHGIDLAASWFIGDILDDVEAGRRAGCRTLLLNNGNETEWVRGPARTPDRMAPDLDAAALVIARSVWPRALDCDSQEAA